MHILYNAELLTLHIILDLSVQTGTPVYFGIVHAVATQPDMSIYSGVTQDAYIQDVTAQPDVPIYFDVTQAAYIQDVPAQPDNLIYFGVTQAAYMWVGGRRRQSRCPDVGGVLGNMWLVKGDLEV